MTYISLPTDETRRLTFYLAMEEYVARRMDIDDAFFIWQVPPTVIFGRNQLIDSEVNIDFCRKRGIQTYRRKSGGGCVYADMGNLMLSYITKAENVTFTFNRYINLVALTLCRLGIDAKATGRNDVLIDGRKVSGNAFYHIPGRSIVHGTLLYDTDMENMVGSITPDDDKLISKGVSSVRQHIALLKDYTQLTLDELKTHVRSTICDSETCLDTSAIAAIEEIEKEYLTDQFIYGHNPAYTLVRKGRIEDVGQFEVRIELKNNIIRDISIMGDFFLVGDLDAGITNRLKNVPLTQEAINQALPDYLGDIILHLQRKPFVDFILNNITSSSTNHHNGKQTDLSV